MFCVIYAQCSVAVNVRNFSLFGKCDDYCRLTRGIDWYIYGPSRTVTHAYSNLLRPFRALHLIWMLRTTVIFEKLREKNRNRTSFAFGF